MEGTTTTFLYKQSESNVHGTNWICSEKKLFIRSCVFPYKSCCLIKLPTGVLFVTLLMNYRTIPISLMKQYPLNCLRDQIWIVVCQLPATGVPMYWNQNQIMPLLVGGHLWLQACWQITFIIQDVYLWYILRFSTLLCSVAFIELEPLIYEIYIWIRCLNFH